MTPNTKFCILAKYERIKVKKLLENANELKHCLNLYFVIHTINILL